LNIGLAVTLLVVVPEIPWKLLFAGFNSLLAWLFIFRFGRLGAYFRPQELTIRRFSSTKHIPWGEVHHFTLGPHGRATINAHVVLVDGTKVWIEGLGSWSKIASGSPETEGLVLEMNRLLPRYRAAAGASAVKASAPGESLPSAE
jgi:hypothetical protein